MKPVLSLLREAARKANLIASGENLNADQELEILEALNTLLDGWALTIRSGNLPQSVKVLDTLYLPDGYASAVMYNLAVQICLDNELPASPELQSLAMTSLAAVRRDGTSPMRSLGAQQSGFASTFLPMMSQNNSNIAQAARDAEKSQLDYRRSASDAQNVALKNATMGAGNLAKYVAGSGDHISPESLMQGLNQGVEAGLWSEQLANQAKGQLPANAQGMTDYVQGYRMRSADPDKVLDYSLPELESQRVDGGAQLGSYNRMTNRYMPQATLRDIPEQQVPARGRGNSAQYNQQTLQPSSPDVQGQSIYAGAVVSPSTVAAFAKTNGMSIQEAYSLIKQSGARFK